MVTKLLRVFYTGLFLTGFLFRYGFSEERVIYCDNFKETKDLTSSGWEIKEGKGPTKWEITEDGNLKVIHCTMPYKGGRIVRTVPAIEKGYFEFECKIGGANNQHLSLQIFLFGQMTAFNGYGSARIQWNRYEGPPTNKWFTIATHIEPDKWHKFRILFDVNKKTFEFYVDDMEDPVNLHENIPVDISKAENCFIGFGDYALCSGEVVNYIRNIRLVEIKN